MILTILWCIIFSNIIIVFSIPLREIRLESRLPDSDGIVLGVDVSNPGISWSFPDDVYTHQVAYHILVELPLSSEIVWDSSIIPSTNTLHIPYNGKPLLSDRRYSIYIKSWGEDGQVYNGQVMFHSGLLNPEADFTGSWIGHNEIYMNQLRKEFEIPSAFTEATAFISGIGYYELYFNNQNVDPTRKLDPGWTTYENRTLYATFNVGPLLSVGTNCIGVLLGNGWYSQQQNLPPDDFVRPSYGPPRLIFQLNIKLANGNSLSVVSDTTWQGRHGFIQSDSVYGGETIDARLISPDWAKPGFKDLLNWISPQIMPSPGGNLSAQMMDPVRTDIELYPNQTWTANNNVEVVDFGQNMAGWIRIKLSGPRGATVQFHYAEILEQHSGGIYNAKTIYTDNLRGAEQTDTYILNGTVGGEVFEPRFTVHGFRYVEIKNIWSSLNGNIIAIPVHSHSPQAGTFKSDNPVLNQIQKNILWSQRSNLMSVPTDCCQRNERKGWMGDAALTIDEALFNFQLAPFYQSWIQSIQEIQKSDGSVPDTTPFLSGGTPADPAWGTAYPTCVMALYDHYGDTQTATKHYQGIKAWVDFLTDAVAKTGFGTMYYHYGDWVPPPPFPGTNQSLTSVAAYAMDALTVSKLAGVLGNEGDQEKYLALYTHIGTQFHKAFYNSSIQSYVGRTLTGNVLALAINAVPIDLKPTIINNIVQIIHGAGDHSVCGILGARWLYPVLSDNGHHDLALLVATKITYPSLGYMFNNPYENATTLWELLNAPDEGPWMNSRNHPMWGSIGSWFYRYVGGIKPNALEDIEISPAPVGPNSPVNKATVTYNSMKGQISVNWLKTPQSFGMDVIIPSTATARVIIPHHESPYSLLSVNGETIADFTLPEPTFFSSLGVQPIQLRDDGSIELKVQPGKYSFKASI